MPPVLYHESFNFSASHPWSVRSSALTSHLESDSETTAFFFFCDVFPPARRRGDVDNVDGLLHRTILNVLMLCTICPTSAISSLNGGAGMSTFCTAVRFCTISCGVACPILAISSLKGGTRNEQPAVKTHNSFVPFCQLRQPTLKEHCPASAPNSHLKCQR